MPSHPRAHCSLSLLTKCRFCPTLLSNHTTLLSFPPFAFLSPKAFDSYYLHPDMSISLAARKKSVENFALSFVREMRDTLPLYPLSVSLVLLRSALPTFVLLIFNFCVCNFLLTIYTASSSSVLRRAFLIGPFSFSYFFFLLFFPSFLLLEVRTTQSEK